MPESSSTVEIDFFRLKEQSSPKKLSARRNIQDVISKINPEILKPAIASAFANNGFLTSKSFTSPVQLQTLPVYNQDCGSSNIATSATSLTIIYNGSVSVFDVSPDQADNIMKLAESVTTVSKTVEGINQNPTDGVLGKDLPMSRKKSLKRFLEKRKERQVAISPYANSQGKSGNACLH